MTIKITFQQEKLWKIFPGLRPPDPQLVGAAVLTPLLTMLQSAPIYLICFRLKYCIFHQTHTLPQLLRVIKGFLPTNHFWNFSPHTVIPLKSFFPFLSISILLPLIPIHYIQLVFYHDPYRFSSQHKYFTIITYPFSSQHKRFILFGERLIFISFGRPRSTQ